MPAGIDPPQLKYQLLLHASQLTPVYEAAKNGHCDVVKYLIEHGAKQVSDHQM